MFICSVPLLSSAAVPLHAECTWKVFHGRRKKLYWQVQMLFVFFSPRVDSVQDVTAGRHQNVNTVFVLHEGIQFRYLLNAVCFICRRAASMISCFKPGDKSQHTENHPSSVTRGAGNAERYSASVDLVKIH